MVAEYPRTKVGVGKNEATEVGNERLISNPRGNKVIVIRDIADMDFGKCLLQGIEIPVTRGIVSATQLVGVSDPRTWKSDPGRKASRVRIHLDKLPGIAQWLKLGGNVIVEGGGIHIAREEPGISRLRVHPHGICRDRLNGAGVRHSILCSAGRKPGAERKEQVAFPHAGPVVVVNGVHPQKPLHRLERRLAFEQVEGDRGVVGICHLFTPAEKLSTIRSGCADAARDGQFAHLEKREILCRQIEKDVLPEDWHVAL